MSERKRRRLTAEYGAESVKFCEESGHSLQSVAEELGVHANQLRGWRSEILAAGTAETLGKQKAEAAELVRLKRENRQLEQENEILKRAAALFGTRGRDMKYAFIVAERATFPVRRLCRLIGVAARASYAWLRRGPTKRMQDEVVLVAEIRGIFEEGGMTYGSPRIHAEPRARGCRIGRKRVARLRREHGLVIPRKKRRLSVTTDSRHGHPIAPNFLEQKFEMTKPNTTWLSDITHVATGEGLQILMKKAVVDRSPVP